jgi:hypothetical protein
MIEGGFCEGFCQKETKNKSDISSQRLEDSQYFSALVTNVYLP